MTGVMSREWVTNWDSVLKRKVILLVDKSPAHPNIGELKSIRLEFLPANTTSLIQPMDQGVIKNFYRQELVQMTITGIEDNLVCSSATAIDISSRI